MSHKPWGLAPSKSKGMMFVLLSGFERRNQKRDGLQQMKGSPKKWVFKFLDVLGVLKCGALKKAKKALPGTPQHSSKAGRGGHIEPRHCSNHLPPAKCFNL